MEYRQKSLKWHKVYFSLKFSLISSLLSDCKLPSRKTVSPHNFSFVYFSVTFSLILLLSDCKLPSRKTVSPHNFSFMYFSVTFSLILLLSGGKLPSRRTVSQHNFSFVYFQWHFHWFHCCQLIISLLERVLSVHTFFQWRLSNIIRKR